MGLFLALLGASMTILCGAQPPGKISPKLRALSSAETSIPVFIVLADQPHRALIQKHEGAQDLRLKRAESRAASSLINELVLEVSQNAFREIDRAVEPSQTALEQILVGIGAVNIHRYRAINMISADIPPAAIDVLEQQPSVAEVFPVESYRTKLDSSAPELGVAAFWNSGWTGAGQSIAVLDTGLRTNHPGFAGKNIVSLVFLSNGSQSSCFDDDLTAQDQQGHGTHVTGIVASQGSAGWPLHQGVAKGIGALYNVKLGYRLKPTSECGQGSAESDQRDFQDAVDWLLSSTPVRIFNYSFGAESTQDDDSWSRVMDQLADTYGALFVIAAGNQGSSGYTINTPGIAYNSLAVANWTSRGTIASSSSRGPTWAGRYKPDLAAPGTLIRSTAHNWESNPQSPFVYKSGTSMAAPHIAGAAALLRQTGLSDSLRVKATLINATDNAGWFSDRGWGYSNLATAREYAAYAVGGSLAPGSAAFQLYKVPSPAALRVSGTWNRHIVGGFISAFNNVDLYAFSAATNVELARSTEVVQNVEQISVTSSLDVVVKVKLNSPTLAGGIMSEKYGLSFSDAVSQSAGPSLTPVCSAPATVAPNSTFSLVCQVTNAGDVPAFGVVGTAYGPSGQAFYDFGALTQNSASASVAANLTAPPATGNHSVTFTVQSSSYGEVFQASATFAVVVAHALPSAPGNPSPGSASTVLTLTPALSWSSTGATSFDVYFGTSMSPPFATNTVAAAYSPSLASGTTYYWRVIARNGYGTASSPLWSITAPPLSATTALRFIPSTPCRVADTRNSSGSYGGPVLASGSIRTFPIPGSGCGIPSTARAYALNITVVPQQPLAFLTLWPAGQPQPFVSTLNSTDGRIKANAAIVAAGSSGGVSVFVTDATHVILDVSGYFVDAGANPTALAFYTLPPCRIFDTRRPAGPLGGPSLAPFQPRQIGVRSSACGAPSNAVAYSLNFTSSSGLPLGWITAWATGTATPVASTLNAPTGTVTANAAIIPAGTSGSISVYASDMTDLIVDINGYFAPPGAGGLSFYSLSPCRVADTRNSPAALGGPTLTGARQFPISTSACGVPANAGALSLNATVAPGPFLGYLTLWPAASAMPVVSTLNAWDAAITSNAAIVPAVAGSISAFSSDPTHLILDVGGYFAP